MAPAVVLVLLQRRPFLPFTLILPSELGVEDGSVDVERSDAARMIGDETLQIVDSKTQEVVLIDLRHVSRVVTSGPL
ncbi:MAG: hypothetical protein ACAI43_27535 [Phycisphaerae bacterium]|nr:hypothetical protein [Tepidisphaeraceae bacterium]